MNSIKTYVNNLGRATRAILLGLMVVFISAGIAQAATTISTNVQTDGTLSVTGVSTLTGAVTANGALNVIGLSTFGATASTTISTAGVITLPTGDTIKNTVASTTALSGSLTVDANITLLNAQAATSSLSVGCIQATATSSATKVKLVFSTAGATSTFAGTTYWSYGTCP